MDVADYVSFKEVFCSIMGIKSSPNNASDDLTCHLNLSYRIEEEFDPEISDVEKTITINDDDLKHEYDKAVEAIVDFRGMEWFSLVRTMSAWSIYPDYVQLIIQIKYHVSR